MVNLAKLAYLARLNAKGGSKFSKAVAARVWNAKHKKPFIPKAFDNSDTARKAHHLLSSENNRVIRETSSLIRRKTGLKGHMPWKVSYFERNPYYEGLGPLAHRKGPLEGQVTAEDIQKLAIALARRLPGR